VELRHLRYFVTIAEERSFLKAAGRLQVAQPALSKQIRDLEREIGATLFQRLPRGVRLTRSGEAFWLEARKTLESAARAAAHARWAQDGPTSRLHFAHGELLVYAPVVADLLAAFRQAYPATDLRVHRLREVKQRVAIRGHRVDLAATFVSTWPVPECAARRLVNTSLTGVLLPASHPLAAQAQVRLRDLGDLTWLHVPSRSWPESYGVLESALRSRGLVPACHRGRSPEPSANVQIAAGTAWALANKEIAAPYVATTHSIVYRPFVEPPIPFWLALIWRLDATSPLLKGLVDIACRLRRTSRTS
jgi:DNA-binding transcriptional LysR family regulator